MCGVSKAAMGSPLIARAMLEGGVTGIGESRVDNAVRLRRNGITAPILMLRIPSITEAPDVVAWTDGSLNSEAPALEALSQAAVAARKTHEVILMVELGDRREGAPPEAIPALSERTMELEGLKLAGLGANFMCASGVMPTREKLELLSRLAETIERRCGITLRYVSGGNSSSLPLLLDGGVDRRINHLRVGVSILLGENPWTGGRLDGLKRDAFLLEGELVEIKTKPSLPEGEVGRDAFGSVPVIKDRGSRVRGIVNLGRLDINPGGLRPHRRGIETVTASSDHMILDLTKAAALKVGDSVDFELDYASLVQAMLSPYVRKHVVGTGPGHSERQVVLFADPGIAEFEAGDGVHRRAENPRPVAPDGQGTGSIGRHAEDCRCAQETKGPDRARLRTGKPAAPSRRTAQPIRCAGAAVDGLTAGLRSRWRQCAWRSADRRSPISRRCLLPAARWWACGKPPAPKRASSASGSFWRSPWRTSTFWMCARSCAGRSPK